MLNYACIHHDITHDIHCDGNILCVRGGPWRDFLGWCGIYMSLVVLSSKSLCELLGTVANVVAAL